MTTNSLTSSTSSPSTAPVFITTSIPYVNAPPHIGFALELVQADVLARFHRLRGDDVRLQTGTDEHAFKNVLAARALGLSTQALVDRHAERFRALASCLDISADDFIRTTEARHRREVEAFWRRLSPDDIYWHTYDGLYCVGCEDYLRTDELVDGNCPDHRRPPLPTSERNLFFRLSRYQRDIERLIDDDTIRIVPATRKAEVLAFIRRGLHDFSLTRSAARAEGWGITVPDEPSQVIYVWIDALINYTSALGSGAGDDDARRFWSPTSRKHHVIGKNVWKFHAVYWPALLLSAQLPLPSSILVHGFLTQDGSKISKSTGGAVDPALYVERWGVDAVRYALLAHRAPAHDTDFTEAHIASLYQSDLANGLGNTLSRLTALATKAGLTTLSRSPSSSPPSPSPSPPPAGYADALAEFRHDIALDLVAGVWRGIDADIARIKPWELLRSERDRERLRDDILPSWLRQLDAAALWLEPFLPSTSRRIRAALAASPLQPSAPLFPRR